MIGSRGRLITLEGIEGAGKTTQRDTVCHVLLEAGLPMLKTREPGGSEIAERIRILLLDPDNQEMSSVTELLLMFAARAEHLVKTVQPALAEGTWVVCDRFTDTSYAYQGAGRGLALEHIKALKNLVQGKLTPNLTLLLDLPAETGLARAKQRGLTDRFESETLDFFRRARQQYLALAAEEPERIRVIDAAASLEQVTATVTSIVQGYIAAERGRIVP